VAHTHTNTHTHIHTYIHTHTRAQQKKGKKVCHDGMATGAWMSEWKNVLPVGVTDQTNIP